eukprot:COSAG03_NODE_1981_length_3263_cov_4.269595_2_plen_611_part_00
MRPYVGRCWRQGRCAALLSLLYWLYLLKSETVQSSGTTLRTLVMTGGDAASIGCVPSEAFNCSYAAFRIPALVNAGGALIAFAEGRRYSCNDFGSSPTGVVNNGTNGQHDLVCRRSTDGGIHWEPLARVVDANASWPRTRFPTQHGSAVWDITPVFDRDTRNIFVMFSGPGRQLGEQADVFCVSSQDMGLTWGTPVNLSSACGSGRTPGDGSGVQVSTGRLIVPLYGAGITICFSDDHGKHWQASEQTVGGALAVEPEITEMFTENADVFLYMTVRNDQPGLPRQYTISSDLGLTWGPLRSLQDVRDPDCKGGVTRWNRGRALVLTHADSCTARANTTVRLSTDGGQSFPFAQLLDPMSGYSTPVMIGSDLNTTNSIGVLYERFVVNGQTNCSIVFATVNATKILNAGGAPPPPPAVPIGTRVAVLPGFPPLHVTLGVPKMLRNSSSGDASLGSRPSIQTLVLGNGVHVIGNGSCAPGGCLLMTKDVHRARDDWTKVDLGAHHDMWFNTTPPTWPWRFEGPLPSCESLHKQHGWDLSTCEARRSTGMCTTAILDACGNHEACRPDLCRSSGGFILTATSDDSLLACYDAFSCPDHGNWSSIWCAEVFDIK